MSAGLAAEQIARRRLIGFARQQDGDLRLAQHAALPVVLSAELLHLIRINFLLDDQDKAPPPFTAEADLLLSQLCHEIGDGLYELDPDVRNILLTDLVSTYGSARLHEVASLLWQYSQGAPAWSDRSGLERAQQLTALNILDPAQAAAWLADAQAQAGDNAPVDEEWFLVMSREHETAVEAMSIAPAVLEPALTDAEIQAYERGLIALAGWLLPGDERIAQLAVNAERLRAVLTAERSYGTTSTSRAERDAILTRLDTLAHAAAQRSFAELCSETAQVAVEPVGAALDAEEREQLRAVLQEHRRRLNVLEIQAAKIGSLYLPPHLLSEIEDFQAKIAQIEARLARGQAVSEKQVLLDAEERTQLTGSESQQLQRALLNAYPTLSDIEQMVLYELGESLDTIVENSNLSITIIALIQWAMAHGRLGDLIAGAQQFNPNNSELQAFIEQVWQKKAAEPSQPADRNAPAENQPPTQLIGQEELLHLDALLQTYRQRLKVLLQQQALSGPNTDPQVLTEIEDIRAEIARVKAQLAANSEPVAPTTEQPSSSETSDIIMQLGIEAAREDNREAARTLFGLLTRQEPDNAQAWLWLAGVAEGPEQRRAALERVIELDPTNELAIKGLQAMGVPVPEQPTIPTDLQSTPNPFGVTGRIDDPAKVFGRDALLQRLFKELGRGVNCELIGAAGVGKSTLLSMVRKLGPDQIGLAPEAFVALDMRLLRNENQFFEILCKQLGLPALRGYDLIDALAGRRRIICLDNIEQMNSAHFTNDEREELRGLIDGEDAPLKLVIASRQPLARLFPDSSSLSSPLANVLLTLNVPPFTPAAVREFIALRLAGTSVAFTETEIAELITTTGGNPARLQSEAARLFEQHRRPAE